MNYIAKAFNAKSVEKRWKYIEKIEGYVFEIKSSRTFNLPITHKNSFDVVKFKEEMANLSSSIDKANGE